MLHGNDNKKRDVNTCISCDLNDDLVECGGIYYCPNPFCYSSGSTNWKRDNLNVRDSGDGLILINSDGWYEKGMRALDKMSYALGSKIMKLDRTVEIINQIKQEITQ